MSGGDISDRRRAGRASVLLTATISEFWGDSKVVVRNLSVSGALVEGEALPDRGSRLLFGSRGVSAEGSIVWTGNGRSGVRFDSEVNYRDAFRRIPAPDRRSRPRPSRPTLKCKPLTEAERAIMRRWATSGHTALGE
jgi:hypothetical protein